MGQYDKTALVVINPAAGLGKAEEYSDAVVSKLSTHGFGSSVIRLDPQNGLIPDKPLSDHKDAELILCCGGDGSLFHIVNECIACESSAAVGLLPFGNANSFANAMGISEDFDSALDTALDGKPYRYDTGKINDRYFNSVASFVSASSMSYVTCQQMENVTEYSKHILRAVGELNMRIGSAFHMTIESENGKIEGNFLYGAVSNISATDTKTNDGIMELFLLKAPETHEETLDILNVLRNGSFEHPAIITSRITGGSFSADTDISLSLDGEFGGIHRDLQLNVLKEKMTVMTPV
jgi:diacylglycerol kinase family enzyme